ncbi:MAG: aspartate aminotransferase family protein [Sedimentisphaerales bacterium]|nr:aspartate aminotransferase family protein [Sedimentisphaerales bacterium]
MNFDEIKNLYDNYVIANYGRLPFAITKGKGSKIWDSTGKEYLDMFPGWAVSGIGHCHDKVVNAICDQAKELIHIDNSFYNEKQAVLGKMLSERSFGGKFFFCNSGAEANEAALKLSRLHTAKNKYKIISFEGGFHGRTMGAVTATAQPKYHKGFLPLVPGFIYLPFNDIDALKAAFDDEVCAVIVEPIQGEGGVRPATPEFLATIRELCDANEALVIWDEVQTGMGRTGKWFGYQHYDIVPDIMSLAKTLGGGISIGAIGVRAEVAASLVPGTHASTFGGNPLACAASIATIEAIEEEKLIENTIKMGQYTMEKLAELQTRHSCIKEVRGKGLMLGIILDRPGADIVAACWTKGVRINCTQNTVIRFMPPMVVTAQEIDAAVGILDAVMTEMSI